METKQAEPMRIEIRGYCPHCDCRIGILTYDWPGFNCPGCTLEVLIEKPMQKAAQLAKEIIKLGNNHRVRLD